MTVAVAVAAPKKPMQARSRARRAALIEYGIAQLERYDLDEISVVEITAALGFSTGSFYSYFQDKEAYFVAIQLWVNDELDAPFAETFERSKIAGGALTDRLRACVDFALAYFRNRTGVIRSALRYERRIPQGWAPNRARTRMIIEAATHGLNAGDKERLETAVQLAFGLLVNALLHDPGPLHLNDPELGSKIIAALEPSLSP